MSYVVALRRPLPQPSICHEVSSESPSEQGNAGRVGP
jgi:hypothetical protein